MCHIERSRELNDRCSREVICAITSLDPAEHGSAVLLQLSRDHWQIENSLFHVRDVTSPEEHCRVRTRSAPQELDVIRDAALNLITKTGQKPRPALEAFADHT